MSFDISPLSTSLDIITSLEMKNPTQNAADSHLSVTLAEQKQHGELYHFVDTVDLLLETQLGTDV